MSRHGACCTCQRCGKFYDECRCDLDEVVDENEALKAKLAAWEPVMRALMDITAARRVDEPGPWVSMPTPEWEALEELLDAIPPELRPEEK
jgi:hypothetical protein